MKGIKGGKGREKKGNGKGGKGRKEEEEARGEGGKAEGKRRDNPSIPTLQCWQLW